MRHCDEVDPFSALRPVIGLTAWVTLPDGSLHLGKVDTAADSSSIDETLLCCCVGAASGPDKAVRCILGRRIRTTRRIQIRIEQQRLVSLFTVADRKTMRFRILIGRDILRLGNFVIDPGRPTVEVPEG